MRVPFACLLLFLFACPAIAVEPPAYTAIPTYQPAKKACPCAFGCKCSKGDPCECSPGCPCDEPTGSCPGKVAVSPRWSAVYVSVDLGNGASAGGSGTVIASEGGNSLVLTNAHVVESANRPIYVTYWFEGEPWRQKATYIGGSSIAHIDAQTIQVNGPDLALLSVSTKLPAVEMASAIPAAGEPVSFFGFGGATATNPLHKSGRYLGDAGWNTTWDNPVARTSINSINGDSGAGILNDRGELVAVHWGGGAVRLDTIHAFTVSTLSRSKRVLFPRLHDRLKARAIAKAVSKGFAAIQPPKVVPKAAPAPKPTPKVLTPASGCPGGVCPAPARARRGLFFRR